MTPGCGLEVRGTDGGMALPVLRWVRCTEATDHLIVHLLRGQTPEDVHRAAAAIAYAFGARAARVYEQRPDAKPLRVTAHRWLLPWVRMLRRLDDRQWADRPAFVHILIARRDPLSAVVRPFPIPALDSLDLSALPLAVASTLDVYSLRLLATHVLYSSPAPPDGVRVR